MTTYANMRAELEEHADTLKLEERDIPDYATIPSNEPIAFHFWLWYRSEGVVRKAGVGIVVFNARLENETAEWYESVPAILVDPPEPSAFVQQITSAAAAYQTANNDVKSIRWDAIHENTTRPCAIATLYIQNAGGAIEAARKFVWRKDDGQLGLLDFVG